MRDADTAIGWCADVFGWLPSDTLDQRIGDVEAIITRRLRSADGGN